MDNDQRQKQLHQINYYRLDRHTLVGITAWIAQGTIMCFASVETSTVINRFRINSNLFFLFIILSFNI